MQSVDCLLKFDQLKKMTEIEQIGFTINSHVNFEKNLISFKNLFFVLGGGGF